MTGLDTETHKGRVVLIATPTNYLEIWRYKQREQWHVLMEWLRVQDSRFVCWNADYDIQAILKLMSREPNEDLWKFCRVDYGRYRIRFIPSKFFTVGLPHGKRKQYKTLFTVYDLMQFYATTLEKAAQRILGEGKSDPGTSWDELYEVLKSGASEEQSRILAYCRNDAALVERIFQESKIQFEKVGVTFEKPLSCASIAVQKFSKVMSHDVPKPINKIFEKTYRGGRIECLKVGYFPKAYLYDLHSAYPSTMADLPETKGSWLPIEKMVRPDVAYAAVLVHVSISRSEYRCPIAVEGITQLLYPYGEWTQWVDLDTYKLLKEKDFVKRIVKGFQLVRSNDNRPFKELRELYRKRELHPDQSWAIKIIMNSLYGKVAQTREPWTRTRVVDQNAEAWRGRFWTRKEQWTHKTNFVYASSITARIRSRLFREVPTAHCIFYATDGVMLSQPITLKDTGNALGTWSEAEVVTDLVVVGSGVYTYKNQKCRDGRCKTSWETVRETCPKCGLSCRTTKVRGYEVGLDLYKLLDRRRRILTLTVKRNWTLAQVMRQHKYPMFNELVDVPRYLDVCFDRKRIWESSRTGRDLLQRSYDSRPWRHYPEVRYEEF